MNTQNEKLMQCITRDRYSLCSESCETKTRHIVKGEADCVSWREAILSGLMEAREQAGTVLQSFFEIVA